MFFTTFFRARDINKRTWPRTADLCYIIPMGKIVKRAADYIREHRVTAAVLLIYTVAFAAFRVSRYSVGYDTEIFLLDPEMFFRSNYEHGRFMMTFLNRLLPFLRGNLTLINILTYVNVFIYTIMFLIFLDVSCGREGGSAGSASLSGSVRKSGHYAGGRGTIRDLLCGILLISSPFFLEHYYFSLQAVPVSLCFILITASFFTTRASLLSGPGKERTVFSAVSAALVFVCVSAYQYFVVIYAVGALICLITYSSGGRRASVWEAARCAGILVFATAAYLAVNKIVMRVLEVTSDSYLGNDWLRLPREEIFHRLVNAFAKSLGGNETVYNLAFTFAILYLLILILRSEKLLSLTNLFYLLLMAAPYLMTLCLGQILLERTSMALTYVSVFAYYLALRDQDRGMRAFGLALAVFAALQTVMAAKLIDGEYDRYNNDILMVRDIADECGITPQTEVCFVGIERTEENIKITKGGTIGCSFFEFNEPDDPGQVEQGRIHNFFELSGHPYAYPSGQLLSEAHSLTFEAEYPESGYWIRTDRGIVVNLGD